MRRSFNKKKSTNAELWHRTNRRYVSASDDNRRKDKNNIRKDWILGNPLNSTS